MGATVSQLVTDFGRSTSLLSSSEYQAKAEDQNSAVTTAQIVLVVDRTFYNVLEMKDLVTVAQKTVDSRQTASRQNKSPRRCQAKVRPRPEFYNGRSGSWKALASRSEEQLRSFARGTFRHSRIFRRAGIPAR